MNKDTKCKHCGHHDTSPVRQEEIKEDRPFDKTAQDTTTTQQAQKTTTDTQADKGTTKTQTKDTMQTRKKSDTQKPQVHSEVYTESTSYTSTGGHYKKEEHVEHKIDGKTVYKKDLWDKDGEVTGKEVDWDKESHKHIKPIGFEGRT